MKTKNLIILIVILILLGLISSFVYWFQYVRPTIPVPAEKPASIPELVPTPSVCVKFLEVQEGITCQKAVELSLGEYPGDVEYVDKIILAGEEILWEVGINLEKPIIIKNIPQEQGRIRVVINDAASEIINVRPGREI